MSNMSTTQNVVPAGWYDDGHGVMRWWDGQQWGPAQPAPLPVRHKFSGVAIAGFVLAVVSVLLFVTQVGAIILAGLAIVFSIAGMADKTRRGRGFAAAGLIIGAAGMTLTILNIIAVS